MGSFRTRLASSGAVAVVLALVAFGAIPAPAAAQYFGQNKVQYENFKFRVMHTQHFDLYYYPAESLVTADAGRMVERWYERYDAPTPIVSAVEGDLVRVRLRITVPAERHFVVVDDALPAGLEAVDLSLRTAAALPGPGATLPAGAEEGEEDAADAEDLDARWWYGSWDAGWWSPWDHKELRDDRVVYVATMLVKLCAYAKHGVMADYNQAMHFHAHQSFAHQHALYLSLHIPTFRQRRRINLKYDWRQMDHDR